MPQDRAFYLANTLIACVMAVLMSQHWAARRESRSARDWMLAAWVLTAADLLLLFRSVMPEWWSRTAPTMMVTAGLAILVQATRRTAGLGPRWGRCLGVVALHGVILVGFLIAGASHSHWRTALNSVVWTWLALLGWGMLRRGRPAFWRPLVSPATVLLVHGLFLTVRTGLAIDFERRGLADASGVLQTIGDLEVAFFMAGLFGSLLVADLLTQNETLLTVTGELSTISGLLPICAWCNKIRDDEGYWSQVGDYIQSHTAVRVTHSICRDCADQHFAGSPPPGVAPAAGR